MLLTALFGIVLLSALVFVGLASREEFVDGYDLWSRVLVTAGFVLWALAFILRLPVFATSTCRRLLAVAFAIVFMRYFLWLFVGGDTALTIFDHLIWAGLLTGLLALCAIDERSQGAPETGWTTGDFGLVAALLAAVVFVVAGGVAMHSDPPIKRVKLAFKVLKAKDLSTPPDISAWTDDPERLARRFSPVLEITDKQRWKPTDVRDYLENADLYDHRDRVIQPPPLDEADLDRRCPPGAPRLCFELTIHCSLDQSDDETCEDGPDGDGEAGVAYARLVRRDRLDDGQAARLFPREGPYHSTLEILLQYWLFYYYDDWQARTIFGQLRQGHEADWEVITIGFSATHPLFVALSAHCAGTWLPWENVRLAGLTKRPTHPMVAVAEGSQANYHDPSANIPPNWARCNGVSQAEVEAANLAYKIRDRTGVGDVLDLDVRLVTDDSPEIRFPGVWGRHNVTRFETAFQRRYELEREHDGPESPAYKPEWSRPVHEIFCTPEWKWVGLGPRLRYEC